MIRPTINSMTPLPVLTTNGVGPPAADVAFMDVIRAGQKGVDEGSTSPNADETQDLELAAEGELETENDEPKPETTGSKSVEGVVNEEEHAREIDSDDQSMESLAQPLLVDSRQPKDAHAVNGFPAADRRVTPQAKWALMASVDRSIGPIANATVLEAPLNDGVVQAPPVVETQVIPLIGVPLMRDVDPFLPVPELSLALSETAAPTLTSPPSVGVRTVGLGQHVAHQVAAAHVDGPGDVTEIALNPEELGRVRLRMTTQENAITLHLTSERSETQDLLRRHIEDLAEEFRNLGYDDVSFSFEQGDQATPPDPMPENQTEQLIIIEEQGAGRAVSTSGLDLRL